ncbi:helix-hairpin-helix domain-containing protein [Bacillus andreraoultii]|uniref:helix-hairpin-helix domain-containing protein n=1 Tax=Bacillus andreraoultii TaxID=1499685 RepID=UPI001E60E053|nr:helix-hairpin-helix domain-containing protein [Bacillus andreraoultii]
MIKEWLQEKKTVITMSLIAVGVIIFYYMNQEETLDIQQLPSVDEENVNQTILADSNLTEQNVMNQNEQPTEVETVKVDIKGAINNPGVYTVRAGERVIDIIDRAGGLMNDADAAKVNLSQKVADEMVIYIPKLGEENIPIDMIGTTSSSTSSSESSDGKVNINIADIAALDTLPGIGPSKAEAIIEYRETNGPFQTVEDLMNISGIGEKTFEKLKDKVTVK